MTQRPDQPLATAVVPCMNEEDNLGLFHERMSAVLDSEFGGRWEIVFVDDGSTDRTAHLIRELSERDPRVRGIRLTRNFGSHTAIAAGLDTAQGDVAIILAADLQDPPEVIPEFVARWREGHDIVWGARETREDPVTRRLMARLFYGLIVRRALPQIPRTGSGSFCLIDGAVIEAFRQFKERNRLTFGIISWSGFSQTEVTYVRAARHAGSSKWSPAQLVKTAIDTFVSFSYGPLRLISYLGLLISLVSFLFGAYVIIDYVLNGTALAGWPSLMTAVLFLGGAQLVTLGVLGEYLWRISEESKSRPLYLVRERINPAGALERESDTIRHG
jgi:dolichol-phosphate mannosyltransferase